ncbi:hypothetical protein CPB83DRAFT_901514 [Crepidotus variabilis]|uniref:Uncharacterized protein n=1 Tax=Crepidotus variabilis TaxID=179855 RepID=A0A9P6JX35_9AGAR|nr:hypothetical protein CPB83DRAFT_901514 [Crepidotus variabilis]
MADEPNPPCYVLLAHSSSTTAPVTLVHPIIQYHYADDSPLSVLPTQADEHVLVLNHNPTTDSAVVQSISSSLVVTGLKVEEAPGAAVDDTVNLKNNSMFIIETTSSDHSVHLSNSDRQSTLANFRQRNALLHKVLEYPSKTSEDDDSPQLAMQPSSLDG